MSASRREEESGGDIAFGTVGRLMRLLRRRPRTGYDGEWTEPLFWVHPGAGVVPTAQAPGQSAVANRELLAPWWIALTEDEQDHRVEDFARDLLTAVARSSDSRVYVELSDNLGVDRLVAALPPGAGHDRRSLRYEFPATDAALAALAMTNPGPLYLRHGDRLVLSLHDDWEAICLHVDDPSLLRAASELTHGAEPMG